jgi:hypothetical protein
MFGGTFTDRVLVSGENVLAKAQSFYVGGCYWCKMSRVRFF